MTFYYEEPYEGVIWENLHRVAQHLQQIGWAIVLYKLQGQTTFVNFHGITWLSWGQEVPLAVKHQLFTIKTPSTL